MVQNFDHSLQKETPQWICCTLGKDRKCFDDSNSYSNHSHASTGINLNESLVTPQINQEQCS